MLTITIKELDTFDEEKQEFDTHPEVILNLEHSLISLSKWESKHQKPFLSFNKISTDEILSYIQMMIIDSEVDPKTIYRCTEEMLVTIQQYIDSPQSATTFGDLPARRGPSEVITSELIYYWMTAFQIPFEAQHWHLNRLFALVRICNMKNAPPQKMSKAEVAQRNRSLNAQRKKEFGTSG